MDKLGIRLELDYSIYQDYYYSYLGRNTKGIIYKILWLFKIMNWLLVTFRSLQLIRFQLFHINK